jgi:hypothetical protein
MMRFRQIPTAGRVIIVAVAVGVFLIALVACWTSYNAIYRLVASLELYGAQTNQVFPLLLDAAFLVAELAAILGGIMRAVTRSEEVSPGWPLLAMVLCGTCTIAFNVAHAYLIGGRGDPLTVWRCVVAALPPILMILSFQVLIAIVKWVTLHLGRAEQAFGGAASAGKLFGVPNMASMMAPEMDSRWQTRAGTGQFGQWGSGDGGGVATTKRAHIEAVLDRLGHEQVKMLGPEGIAEELASDGIEVHPRYVRKVLDARAATGRNGHGKP